MQKISSHVNRLEISTLLLQDIMFGY